MRTFARTLWPVLYVSNSVWGAYRITEIHVVSELRNQQAVKSVKLLSLENSIRSLHEGYGQFKNIEKSDCAWITGS